MRRGRFQPSVFGIYEVCFMRIYDPTDCQSVKHEADRSLRQQRISGNPLDRANARRW